MKHLYIILSLVSVQAFSQKISLDTLKTNDLSEVTVRSAKDLSDRKQSSAPTLVYTSKDFERFELTTIGDYMRSLPGVVMTQGNESKDVRFRGLDKEYTQILIDGERIPDGGEKREFNADRIPLNMVERIEILRSPTANIDAQGSAGTINIVLKKAGGQPTLRINGSLGRVGDIGNVADTYLQYGGSLGKNLSFMLNGGYQSRIVPKTKTVESFKNNVLSTFNEDNEIKKYNEANFAPRLNWKISKKSNFNFDPLYLFSREDKNNLKPVSTILSGKTTKTIEDNNEVKDRTGWALRGTYTYKANDKFDVSFRPLYQDYREVKDKLVYTKNAENVQTKKATEIEDKTDIEKINRLTINYLVKNNHFNLGLESGIKDRKKDKTATENDKAKARAAKDFYEAKETRWNAFLIDNISFGKHNISPAIRWEYTEMNSKSQYIDATKKEVNQERKHDFQTLNPSINYVFRPNNNLNFRASSARTVRRPQFDALTPYLEIKSGTLTAPDTQGNPDLIPETSTGGDIGAEYFFGKNNELGVFGLNFFGRKIENFMENQVSLDPTTKRYVSMPVNAGDGSAWGIELDGRYEININGIGKFIPKGNYTYLGSEIFDTKQQKYRKFKGQPDYVFNVGLEFISPNKRFSIGTNYNEVPINVEAESKTDGTYEEKESTNIRRFDIFANYTLSKKVSMRLAGQNLFTKPKSVYKRVYAANGTLNNYDIETEIYNPTFMLSLQFNLK